MYIIIDKPIIKDKIDHVKNTRDNVFMSLLLPN